MRTIELTDVELAFINACIKCIKDLPVGFEAIEGYECDLQGEDLWSLSDSVTSKIYFSNEQ